MDILETIIGWLAPYNCLACGREGQLLCGWCLPEVLMTGAAACFSCGQPTPFEHNHICTACKPGVPFEHLWIATDYDGIAGQLVRQFKFNSTRSAAQSMAVGMQAALPYLDQAIIVPVPTATNRIRQRGYDHTLLLAKELSKLVRLAVKPGLGRLGQTRQVGTRRRQRLQQLEGAYYVKRPKLLSGQHVLLLDDVMTTGATMIEAAKTIKQAGADKVDAVVFAWKQ